MSSPTNLVPSRHQPLTCIKESPTAGLGRSTYPIRQQGAPLSIANPTIAEDEYRIYVGARNFSGPILGIGGAGGWGSAFYEPTGVAEIDAIDSQFENAIRNRGETSGFTAWGGSLAFDTNSNWHYDHTTLPQSGSNKNDFYSVAIHELSHTLGLGGSSEWNALVSGGFFTGNNSQNAFGSPIPLNSGGNHWAENTMSRVYGWHRNARSFDGSKYRPRNTKVPYRTRCSRPH